MRSESPLEAATSTLARVAALPLPEALTRLDVIAAALPSCGAPERLDAIAAALPQRLGELAPELGLALARLAAELLPHAPSVPDDIDEQAPSVRVAWLRIALALDPASGSPDAIDESSLLRVLDGWSVSAAADPHALALRLAKAADPRLRAMTLAQIRRGVSDLALTPEQGFWTLAALLEDTESSIRREAYAALLDPWAQQLSGVARAERKRIVRAGLGDADRPIVRICVGLATQLDQRQWLIDLLDDESVDASARETILLGLGPLATREDLEVALTLAVGQPLRWSASTRAFLLAAHRHGAFLDDSQVPLALEAYDLHEGWTAEAFVRVTHIARAALIDELGKLRATDPRWIRRAAILAASVGTGAHLLIAELLAELHERGASHEDVGELRIAAALIEAAGASPEYADEGPLLAWLPRLPELLIPVLRVKGGPRAAVRLQALVEDPRCPEPLRGPALRALWALAEDRPGLLRALSSALGPRRSGLLDTELRAARDPLAASLYLEAPWADDPAHELDPGEALELLCEAGELRFLPEITRLFRLVYTRTVQQALAGQFSIKRVELPRLEQLIYRYGRHLIAGGRAVRRFLAPTPETGRDLLVALTIDWLREHPAPPLRVALLETIARHEPAGPELRFIEPFWRDSEANVQRAALEALLEAGEGARGLELSIGRMTSSTDPRILQQALGVVAQLGAAWAEPLVIAALGRPQIAVKQGAAWALSTIGSGRCIPALIGWLASHDNHELRRRLLDALDHAAGDASLAVLVDALELDSEGSAGERRQKLLHHAISGRLTLAATLRLAASRRHEIVALVDAAVAGHVKLADATPERLADALHRARLRPAPSRPDPTRRLRVEGFSPEAALAVLDCRGREHDDAILRVVRRQLASWVTWLSATPTATTAAVELVLAAAGTNHGEHVERLLDLAEAEREQLDPALVTAFIDRCVAQPSAKPHARARALDLLRSLAPTAEVRGVHRYRLLARLGAVRGRADLDACLSACRIGPDLVADSERLLSEALSIPSPRDDEPAELEAVREQVRAWHRKPLDEAAAWLSASLDQRPLDLPRLPDAPTPPRPEPWTPRSERDRAALLDALDSDDPTARELAAARLLAWSDAQASWPAVLERFLTGALTLDSAGLAVLAGQLDSWPRAPESARAAALLIPHLTRLQQRCFVPTWLDSWSRKEPEAAAILARIDQSLLIPHARARAEAGDYGLCRVLRPDASLALAELVAFVHPRAAAQVEHLMPRADNPDDDSPSSLVDPIASLDLDGLAAVIHADEGSIGLAVRAVHALAKHAERGADLLAPLALDRRPRIRSAALRALRKVALPERTLAVTAQVLGIETRRDVILSLISSLGYRRHEPSAPALLEYLTHRDAKLREAAYDTLRAWGRDIAPTLRRASRRARPDRRRVYDELIDELERES
ncbi:hypothetical protein ENSA5_07690 [Enhygromyxa salina]|uniref:HEAT repeat protein n=1 Tax=Enhygromyxa salina TaxID=215803 RepID=A0A2S9YH32_9BACT|nr:HEAT repeat domain-containing protein [Enhygromyxa salina]PRQ04433.1 hypothetical protein ENSA5_07690 [Enhygromyxa salina]